MYFLVKIYRGDLQMANDVDDRAKEFRYNVVTSWVYRRILRRFFVVFCASPPIQHEDVDYKDSLSGVSTEDEFVMECAEMCTSSEYYSGEYEHQASFIVCNDLNEEDLLRTLADGYSTSEGKAYTEIVNISGFDGDVIAAIRKKEM